MDNPIINGGHGRKKIKLSTLVDFMIQKAYHDLTVLTEILPRKADIDRKIAIYRYSTSMRQQFIRLLAVVKWATKAEEIDKCFQLCDFLEQEGKIFINTADELYRIANEMLPKAKLPYFDLTSAAEALSRGSYSLLPTCIKEKIVPLPPMTREDKWKTLEALNEIIKERLIRSQIPQGITKTEIANGQLVLTVEGEFEVVLTLLGDDPKLPWRLLSVRILVEDADVGAGKSLMHALQVQYVQRQIQSRLFDSDDPLHDLYISLHYLCLSLQLEVLHSQAEHLIAHRWTGYVKLTDHMPGKRICLSYWSKKTAHDSNQRLLSDSEARHELMVFIDQEKNDAPLIVKHFPEENDLPSSLDQVYFRQQGLLIETLLMEVIEKRSIAVLMEVKQSLLSEKFASINVTLEKDKIPALAITLIDDEVSSERLLLSVDTKSGNLKAVLSRDSSVIQDNVNVNELNNIILHARTEIHLRVCEKMLALLPVTCYRRLPIHLGSIHLLSEISENRVFIRLNNLEHYYLVVGVRHLQEFNLEESFYLMCCDNSTPDQPSEDGLAQCGSLLRIKDLKFCHISDGYYHYMNDMESIRKKRKLDTAFDISSKLARSSKKFSTNVVDMVAITLSTVPYLQLCEGLREADFLYQVVSSVIHGDNIIRILRPSKFTTPYIDTSTDITLMNLIDFRIRLVETKLGYKWLAEITFKNHPVVYLKASKAAEEPIRLVLDYNLNHKCSSSTFDVSSQIRNDWKAIAMIYRLTKDITEAVQAPSTGWKHYFLLYDFGARFIVLRYGPGSKYLIRIGWDNNRFELRLGSLVNADLNRNPHHFIVDHLQHDLNRDYSIVKLLETLYTTCLPLHALLSLSTSKFSCGIVANNTMTLACTILSLAGDRLKIVYRNCFSLDLYIKNSNSVLIHDLGKGTDVGISHPAVPGLKEFVRKFADTVDTSMIFNKNKSDNQLATTEDTYCNRPSSADNSHADARLAIETLKEMTSTVESPPLPYSTSPFISDNSASSLFFFPTTDYVPGNSSSSGRRTGENQLSSSLQSPVPNRLAAIVSGNEMQTFSGNYLHNSPTRLQKQEYLASLSKVSSLSSAKDDFIEISQDAFCKLLEPVNTDEKPMDHPMSPFERYLCCAFLFLQFKRSIKPENSRETSNPASLKFRTESVYAELVIAATRFPTLQLLSQSSGDKRLKEDDMRILAKFFKLKVASYPYKCSTLLSFVILIMAPLRVLEDCIKIMRLELFPNPKTTWKICWCLTLPPNCPINAPLGSHAVALRAKLLIFLQLWKEGITPLVIPLVCDVQDGAVTFPEETAYPDGVDSNLIAVVKSVLKSPKDPFASSRDRCQLYETVQEILAKLQSV